MNHRPPIIDVHSHLHGEAFDHDRPAVIGRARASGIKAILLMGEGPEDNERALEVARTDPCLHPCVGFHPERSDGEGFETALAQVTGNLEVIAGIGEVGLDFWKAREPEERQRQENIFRSFIQLASEKELPLSVHSRSAGRRTLEILEEMGACRVCMHAFDGRAHFALDAAERLGYLFSIPASVIRSRQKQKLATRLPLTHLLLETDSPALGPEPGARNEPSNIILAARKVAELKKVSLDEVLEAAWENTCRMFPGLGASGRAALAPACASGWIPFH